MDATLVLANSFLAVSLVNIADWAFVRRGSLNCFTQRHKRYFIARYAVFAVAAVCLLLRWIPSTVMGWIVFPPLILEQLTSIWMRHTDRATHGA